MRNDFSLREVFEKKDWNPALFFPNTPFTQSFEYGEWQKASGKKVRRFVVDASGKSVCFFQIIFFKLASARTYGYIPYGPVSDSFSEDLLKFLKRNILDISKEEKAVFTRLDPMPNVQKSDVLKVFSKPHYSSFLGAHFQPRYEWVLSLSPNLETLLENMHQKTRYSVRLAEKKGVKVKIVESGIGKYLPVFLNLMETTSSRNSFSLHDKEYYKNIFTSLEGSRNVFLSVASLGENILAIDFMFVYGDTVMYVFGGSSNESRNVCAPHLSKWKAIEHAKSLGAKFFNFGGIEDPEKKLYKSWEGITEFKKKFGGEILEHSDLYDVVVEPLWYFLYNFRKLIKMYI